MNVASPLRYPGGKSSLADLLARIRRLNDICGTPVAEPFAGGAGASLRLLFSEETTEIFLNDADPAIHDFWWTVVHRSGPFLAELSGKRVCMAEWRRQRDIYRNAGGSRLRRGFAAFYLNRCNRSGIIVNGGPVGGVKQEGQWKLDARFNKSSLRTRLEKIAEYRSRIQVSGQDGIDFIDERSGGETFFFIDPPYYVKGKTLYLNSVDEKYHHTLAAVLRSLGDKPWVLTYDDCPPIRRLYRGWANIRPFSLRYVAEERRNGRELLITPRWMRLPAAQSSASVMW